ncbi:hypothetical protein AWJ20_3716 [Sugiyamaella lignohabitans]|uniref:Mediator of RNA polymerase II transcription subunit 21 n=1 Tax=Sugiyamaella lignohabitans TaxID=796027 RepID=A0A167BWS0_9ASCO|nr:uncharacterized protein AWJ20_3716 [Sugiyamaella lignohabitans]ANB10922.1 hypothetical protein AWJ20_3716 [Sugiyamaella lignohabitans]
MTELARDMILKSQQIEVLIDSLPGIGISEQEQMARVRSLEEELKQVNNEKADVLTEREELLKKCDELILEVAREKVNLEKSQSMHS